MSKGKEKIVDNELEFQPNLLKDLIFNPKIPVRNTSVRDSVERMSFETSTSSEENGSNTTSIDEVSNTEQTLSESQERNSTEDGGEQSLLEEVRPEKK